MNVTALWIRAFLLTVGVEEAVAVPLLAPVEASVVRRAAAVLLVNLATHPLVWFFFPRLGWPRTFAITLAEVWAFGFEVVGYRVVFPKAPWWRCGLVSVAANLVSLLVGLGAAKWGWLRP